MFLMSPINGPGGAVPISKSVQEENWFDLAQNRFMFFDRYEIHIQAFVDFINGKLITVNPNLRLFMRS